VKLPYKSKYYISKAANFANIKLKNAGGFSTLEILIASALGLIIIAGICQVYLSVKNTYQKQANLIDLQENIRFATYTLTQNIRMAGYAGCAKLTYLKSPDTYYKHPFTSKKLNNLDFIFESSLLGFSNNNLPNYLLDKKVKTDTDVIVIQKSDIGLTRFYGTEITPATTSIVVKQNPATKNNPLLFLASCKNAEIFQAKEIGGTQISLSGKDNFHYRYNYNDSTISSFTEVAYFISTSSKKDIQGKTIYSLFMVTNRGDKEEIITGINSMKIAYGLLEKQPITYHSAREIDALKAWQNIKCVRILLTLATNNTATKTLELYIALRERI